ncbi:hypothetical protein MBLNU459_g5249t1 [Dothideomycetes sp. NU459]
MDRYPHDWLRHSYYYATSGSYEKGWHFFVAEEESLGDGHGASPQRKIVGFAQWQRSGKSEAAQKWQKCGFASMLRAWYWSLLVKVFDFFDRSRDKSEEKRYMDGEDIEIRPGFNKFLEDDDSEYWWLGLLGVTPEAQGRGIGRKLTEWGVDNARRENVALGVRCVVELTPFYRTLGFGDVVTRSLVGDPMEEVQLAKIPMD